MLVVKIIYLLNFIVILNELRIEVGNGWVKDTSVKKFITWYVVACVIPFLLVLTVLDKIRK